MSERPASAASSGAPAAPEVPDLAEKGRATDGSELSSHRRLFMQLHVFSSNTALEPIKLITTLRDQEFQGVLYADVTNPYGFGLLSISENPSWFVYPLRQILKQEPFTRLTLLPEYTMFGRTYSIGYESDLDETLLRRPVRTALNPAWPWAVWYPLRREGAFETLDAKDQRRILAEHGSIGRAFGGADLAHDVRLAGHGLMRDDNDFVIGLVGKELQPLSAVVQRMRRTEQTSRYMEKMGPFFVGHAIWKSQLPPAS